MSTQLDLVPIKPTTAIVGEADVDASKKRSTRSGSGCWSTTGSPPPRRWCSGWSSSPRSSAPCSSATWPPTSTWTTPTRRRSPSRTAGPTSWAPTRSAAACWPGSSSPAAPRCRSPCPPCVISAIVGSLIGMWAGYYRGWRETIAMRVADVIMSFPSLLLAVVVLYVFSPSAANIVLVLAITRIPVYLRTARAESAELQSRLFVDAARTFGAARARSSGATSCRSCCRRC